MSTVLQPSVYGQLPPTVGSTLPVIGATTTDSVISTTYTTPTTTSTSSSTVHVTSSHESSSKMLSTSSYSSVRTSSSSAPSFTYTQIVGGEYQGFTESAFDQAPFDQLCPGGDCYQSCQNFTLLFDMENYVYHNVTSDFTLFGICTNIAEITDTVVNDPTSLPHATSFFSNKTEQAAVNSIPANISMCLYDTCQATRDPTQCRDLCWPDNLDADSTGIMNFNSVWGCMRQLCSNVCGLPYANQDVFGIGVLWSYGFQAIVILAYTLWLIVIWLARNLLEPSGRWTRLSNSSTFLHSISQANTKRHKRANWLISFSKRVNEAAVSFLAAECFFGVSLAVAAMLQHPGSIDPLNGYALLSVAITGFLPPIFTLMLLHSQRDQEWRPWFSTALVAITWALSTLLFWILYLNLSAMDHSDNATLARARNGLFNVSTCGGYSAMSICQENTDNDPLRYMMAFYNYDVVPGIQTIWMPWVFATFVFFVIITIRVFAFFRVRNSRQASKVGRQFTRVFWVFSTCLLLFGFIYQYRMYMRFKKMAVIDTDNWTFGQIVALLVWAPVVLDIFLRPGLDRAQDWMREKEEPTTSTKDIKMSNISPSSSRIGFSQTQYQPLGHASPLLATYPTQQYSPYIDAHPSTPRWPV